MAKSARQTVALIVFRLLVSNTLCADYRPPAGDKPAFRGENGAAILPGGRVVQPLGTQIPTGTWPVKIVASPSGKRFATANLGTERSSVTLLEQDRKGEWSLRNILTGASGGIAFAGEKSVWVSEGQTGDIRLLDTESGGTKKRLTLNSAGSFSGDLAFDPSGNFLYVADTAHDRVVVFDTRSYLAVAEIVSGPHPRCVGLSPDGKRAYILATNAVSVFDVSTAALPKLLVSIPTGDAGDLLVTPHAVFVSHPNEDSIQVIDPTANAFRDTIELRIPGLENLRGINPQGMSYDESRHWLLVAEAGINAVGVIDPQKGEVLGHLPVGWFPTSAISLNGFAMVTNAKANGTGPSPMPMQMDFEFEGIFQRGSISRFELPPADALLKPTRLALAVNGLLRLPDRPHPDIPVRHVVIIIKGSRTFDDILGDMKIPNSAVAGRPQLARLGNAGYADGGRKRFSLQDIPVTPNHHALALRFTFSDNFYADPDQRGEGLVQHLESHHISTLDFDEPFHADIPDQSRASRFIFELNTKYKETGKPLPQFILLHLPNDQTAPANPQVGYPYAASYASDNDLALGRVIDYLSHSDWWRDMAIFVTGKDGEGGRDHIDSHRIVFLGIGPYFRKGYVSHVNASYPADAEAADLDDMFTTEPDDKPYELRPIDPRLFDPSALRGVKSP
jgi:DNA-binding beta-propeller fold protein YncE